MTSLDDAQLCVELGAWALGLIFWPQSPRACPIDEAARRTGCKVMKAARVRDAAQVRALRAFHTDFHLLDAYVPETPGGTGATFNWELAKQHEGPAQVVLSGGLTPDNVGEAIAVARPFAVDTASGTEASPGRKDPGLVKAFFRAAEQAAAPA